MRKLLVRLTIPLLLLVAAAACDGTMGARATPVATLSNGLTAAVEGLAQVDEGLRRGAMDGMRAGAARIHEGRAVMRAAVQAMANADDCPSAPGTDEVCRRAMGEMHGALFGLEADTTALEDAVASFGARPSDEGSAAVRRGIERCRAALDPMRTSSEILRKAACHCRAMRRDMTMDAGATDTGPTAHDGGGCPRAASTPSGGRWGFDEIDAMSMPAVAGLTRRARR